MATITTDLCIIGTGTVGLFAVLEAGTKNMRCCLLDTVICNRKDPSELALSDYLKEAIAEYDPIIFYNEFMMDIVKTEHGGFLVTTSNSRKIRCKKVIFAKDMSLA